MSEKLYKARTLKGAQTRVRQLMRTIGVYENICTRLKHERRLMAMLAADTPQFSNPLVVAQAQQLRNDILREIAR